MGLLCWNSLSLSFDYYLCDHTFVLCSAQRDSRFCPMRLWAPGCCSSPSFLSSCYRYRCHYHCRHRCSPLLTGPGRGYDLGISVGAGSRHRAMELVGRRRCWAGAVYRGAALPPNLTSPTYGSIETAYSASSLCLPPLFHSVISASIAMLAARAYGSTSTHTTCPIPRPR